MKTELFRNLLTRFRSSTYWKDIAWLASGTVVAQIITLATMPVFSRLFAPADFAIQNLFNQIVAFMAVAATLRYEYFIQLPKRIRDGVRLIQMVAFLGIFASVLLTPVAWLFRETFARWAGDVALAPWLVFAPVSALALSFGVAVQGGAQRRRLFRRSGESDVAGKVGYAGSILMGYFLLPGAGGLVLSGLSGTCIKIGWLLRGTHWFRFGKCTAYWHLAREHSRLSGSLVLSHVLLACTSAIPVFFIAHTYGAAALGQYALAYQAILLPSTLLGGAIGNVYYQRASDRWAKGLSFEDIWRSTAKKLLLIGIPFYGTAALAMPWMFPLVFGDVWQSAGRYGAILAFSAFFSFATSPMGMGCVVVGAWQYALLWHAARTVTTGLVAGMAFLFHWEMDIFIMILAAQQTLLYLIDYLAEWRFAHHLP